MIRQCIDCRKRLCMSIGKALAVPGQYYIYCVLFHDPLNRIALLLNCDAI
jgi:hypothetical protein